MPLSQLNNTILQWHWYGPDQAYWLNCLFCVQLHGCNLDWPSWGWEVHLNNKPTHLLSLKLSTGLLCCIAFEVVELATVCNNAVEFVLLAAC